MAHSTLFGAAPQPYIETNQQLYYGGFMTCPIWIYDAEAKRYEVIPSGILCQFPDGSWGMYVKDFLSKIGHWEFYYKHRDLFVYDEQPMHRAILKSTLPVRSESDASQFRASLPTPLLYEALILWGTTVSSELEPTQKQLYQSEAAKIFFQVLGD